MSKTNDQATKFVKVCPAIMNARGDVDEAAFEAAQNLIAAFESVAGPDAECIDDLCDELETALSNRLVYLTDKAWRRVDEDGELTEDGEEVMAQARTIYRLMSRAHMTIGDIERMITD